MQIKTRQKYLSVITLKKGLTELGPKKERLQTDCIILTNETNAREGISLNFTQCQYGYSHYCGYWPTDQVKVLRL